MTEVWSSACVELYTEDVKVFHSIDEQFEYFCSLNCNIIAYYHNLKFDGSFWLSYLMKDLRLRQSIYKINDSTDDIAFNKPKDMKNNEFTYSISSMGQWYRIIIKIGGHIIELRDSLKLLPFSVEKIGKSFGTKHHKLEMKYEGKRYAGCEITDEELEYIKNDVLVVKEALEIMFNEGHKRLTIGSCCLAEYKKSISGKKFDEWFPNVYDIDIPNSYGSSNVGDYIHSSYHGGWCYLARGKEGKIYSNGLTIDVNSLYPSVMSSESGSRYPIGLPIFWHGDYIPDEALDENRYYFIRIKTRFKIKSGKLPFIQIKHSFLYKGTEMLETSDIYNHEDGNYYSQYIGLDGDIHEATVTMTMTCVDYTLFREHYDVYDFEILDGCYFEAAIGLFDDYIEKYKQQKLTTTGAKKESAKLFLNNLYGKMASSTVSNFKVAYLKEDGTIGFYTQLANDKTPGYIPVGSAITSYARNFTIRAAQLNYYGPNSRGFIYADTDSIHCDLSVEELKGVKLDSKNFCCWKPEASWDVGLFVRQKTYLEHVVKEELQAIDGYYNIKCAGMPERCKKLLISSITGKCEGDYTDEEREFISVKRDITDFKLGLKVPGKLLPRRIPGGVILMCTTYEMR